jgi:hypothetical protein
VRQRSIADITFNRSRLTCLALARRHPVPWSRKISASSCTGRDTAAGRYAGGASLLVFPAFLQGCDTGSSGVSIARSCRWRRGWCSRYCGPSQELDGGVGRKPSSLTNRYGDVSKGRGASVAYWPDVRLTLACDARRSLATKFPANVRSQFLSLRQPFAEPEISSREATRVGPWPAGLVDAARLIDHSLLAAEARAARFCSDGLLRCRGTTSRGGERRLRTLSR